MSLVEKAIELRPAAIFDADAFFCWRNNKYSSKNYINSNIVQFEGHLSLLQSSLLNPKRFKVIGRSSLLYDDARVVRIDISAVLLVEISINSYPKYRGNGFGAHLLKVAGNYFWSTISQKLSFKAFEKEENKPSLAAFRRAGYKMDIMQNGYIRLINHHDVI